MTPARTDPVTALTTTALVAAISVGALLCTTLAAIVAISVAAEPMTATCISALVICAVCLVLRRAKPSLTGYPLPLSAQRTELVPTLAVTAFAGFLTFLIGQGLAIQAQLRLGSGGFKDVAEAISQADPWMVLLATVVAAPIAEEMLMRGVVYPALRTRVPTWVATAITTVIFGVIHSNLVQFLAVGALSVLLCLLYERTHRLSVCIGMHMGFNVLAFFAPVEIVQVFSGVPVIIALVTAFGWTLTRLDARLRTVREVQAN